MMKCALKSNGIANSGEDHDDQSPHDVSCESSEANGVEPQEEDVLLGRGKKFHQHSGNILYTDLVNEGRDRYFSTLAPLDKKRIIEEIVDQILTQGRFLQRTVSNGDWAPISRDRALTKTAHAIQYRQRKMLNNNIPERHSIPLYHGVLPSSYDAFISSYATNPRFIPSIPQSSDCYFNSGTNQVASTSHNMLHQQDSIYHHVNSPREKKLCRWTRGSNEYADDLVQQLERQRTRQFVVEQSSFAKSSYVGCYVDEVLLRDNFDQSSFVKPHSFTLSPQTKQEMLQQEQRLASSLKPGAVAPSPVTCEFVVPSVSIQDFSNVDLLRSTSIGSFDSDEELDVSRTNKTSS